MEFFFILDFFLGIINLCLLVSILRTCDDNTDLLLDIEKNQRRFDKFIARRKK